MLSAACSSNQRWTGDAALHEREVTVLGGQPCVDSGDVLGEPDAVPVWHKLVLLPLPNFYRYADRGEVESPRRDEGTIVVDPAVSLGPIPARMWSSRKAASTPVATSDRMARAAFATNRRAARALPTAAPRAASPWRPGVRPRPRRSFRTPPRFARPSLRESRDHPRRRARPKRAQRRRSPDPARAQPRRGHADRHPRSPRRRTAQDRAHRRRQRCRPRSRRPSGPAAGSSHRTLDGRTRRDECPVPPHRAGAVGRACSSLACPRSREPESPPGRRPHER